MARAFLLSFEAHSYSYVTKMIDKNAPSGRVRSSRGSAAQTPSVSIENPGVVVELRYVGN